jgi:hypothetical protein
MNIYQKLQKCRIELQELPMQKSGENKFAGYSYFELSDFIPNVNKLFDAHGLCSLLSFTADMASLSIFNSEAPEEFLIFTSPMSSASLKGCHDVQNLGAVQSYLRRYLYLFALEIVEHDGLDATQGKEPNRPAAQSPRPAAQPPKPLGQGATADPKDAEHVERVKTALKTLFGDDKQAALAKVEVLTSFIPKGKTEADRVKGVRDFSKLTGTRLTILTSNLEKLAGGEHA